MRSIYIYDISSLRVNIYISRRTG